MAPAVVQAPPTRSGNGEEKQQQQIVKSAANVAMTARGFMPTNMEEAWRFADALSKTDLVPQSYRGNPSKCFIALDLSARYELCYLTVMQHFYEVHGAVGMDAQVVLTRLNQSGLFTDPVEYEEVGSDPYDKGYKIRAFATRKRTSKVVYGPWITWKLVSAEAWDTKSGSKWRTMPEQMFRYRAVSWFAKSICPEATLGMSTTDELQDAGDRRKVESRIVEAPEVGGVEGLKARMKQQDGQTEATAAPVVKEKPTEGNADPFVATTAATVSSAPATDEPKTNGKPKLLYRCKDADCESKGEPFEKPTKILKGKKAGTLLCPTCAGENIEPIAEGGQAQPSAAEALDAGIKEMEQPKPKFRCLSANCGREYVEKPAGGCECGSQIGFKSL